MYKKIYVLLIVVLSFASCTDEEAVKFNDDFIEEQNALQKILIPIDEKIAKFTIFQNFDSTAAQAELAEKAITKTIKKSSCMGSNVEFRSSDSIRNLEGTLGQPALPK